MGDISKLNVGGTLYDIKDAKARTDVSDLKEDIDDVRKSIIISVESFDSTESGVVYNTSNTSGVSWSGGHSYIKAVSRGQTFGISTTIPGSASRSYYAVLLYNDSTYVSGVYQGGTTDNDITVTNYPFTIPSGVNKIIVSTYNNVTPVLTNMAYVSEANKLANNYVAYDGTTLTIKGRYNTAEDLVVTMKKRGNNNLFDFDKVFATARTDILNGNFISSRAILTSNTDCFSPHQMYAVNNADGDGGSYFLTGGNHNKNGVATAYCDDLEVWVDGVKTTDFAGLANHIKVSWKNHITGWNTFKTDGTGRTILTEHITLDIEGLTFNAVVEQIPTEDLYQSVYYGLMSINVPYPKLRFIGGSNRAEIATNTGENSGDLNCRRTIAYNTLTGDQLETYIENEDLGTFALTGQTYSAFIGNNKAYYTIIEPSSKRMNQNQLFTLRGFYKFSSIA